MVFVVCPNFPSTDIQVAQPTQVGEGYEWATFRLLPPMHLWPEESAPVQESEDNGKAKVCWKVFIS